MSIILKKEEGYALDVEAGILPIKIRLKQILAQFGIKLLRKSNSNPLKIIMSNNLRRKNIGKFPTLADKIRMALSAYTKNKINLENIEAETPVHKIEKSMISTDLFLWEGYGNSSTRTQKQKDEMKNTVENFLNTIPNTDFICFTDGSVINPDCQGIGQCGAGAIIYNNSLKNEPITIENKVSDNSTAYHGEIYAIKTALNTCKNLSLDKVKKIHILSDCQSAITSVVNNKASKCHQDVINDTNKMAKDFSDKNIEVVLSWIGGHSDILGNHLADTAAKNGANKPENKQTKITLKIAKNII